MLLGIYKSFEDLENHLTIEEMNLLLKADAKKQERNHRFLAALQGHKWGDEDEIESAEDVVERMKNKAIATANGITDEQIELEEMGIKFG